MGLIHTKKALFIGVSGKLKEFSDKYNMKFGNATAGTENLGISSKPESNNATSLPNGHTTEQLVTREYSFDPDCSFVGCSQALGVYDQ
jgi:hypothetical protein